ncbi:Formamidopyrimidine-DNA glycosylase [Platanthera zijinensis]|uniref:Formamidopyrimidine-DNA glycosylase n=1 Tax=Platanthera zijinensis TaxID=2320716 RepID=A0AAP0AS53_9ASPA
MPELPEVEAARRAIEEHCVGNKIRRCVVADDSKVIDGVPPSDLESALVGKTIVAALRKGKNLWLRLDSPPFPSFQFGMTGAVYIKGVAVTKYRRSAVSDKDEWPSKFSKVFIELEDGLELSFTDKRRLAKVRLLKDPEAVPPISELGPDALLEPLQIDEFAEVLRKKKTAIKALLLDQSFVSGIGNWIADEVLYQASIHPLQTASSLSREECESLHRSIKEVIEKAVEVEADSTQFPSSWIFHSREKKPGKAFVDGKQIEFITAGGRTSAFVPELQKLSGVKSVKVKSNQSRKAKADDEVEDEGDGVEEKEEEIKRPQPVRGKKSKGSNRKQQKKKEDDTEHAGGEEKPKKNIGKKPLTDDTIQKEAVKENRAKSKSIKGKAEAQEDSSKAKKKKKRTESNEASRQQKKKARK